MISRCRLKRAAGAGLPAAVDRRAGFRVAFDEREIDAPALARREIREEALRHERCVHESAQRLAAKLGGIQRQVGAEHRLHQQEAGRGFLVAAQAHGVGERWHAGRERAFGSRTQTRLGVDAEAQRRGIGHLGLDVGDHVARGPLLHRDLLNPPQAQHAGIVLVQAQRIGERTPLLARHEHRALEHTGTAASGAGVGREARVDGLLALACQCLEVALTLAMPGLGQRLPRIEREPQRQHEQQHADRVDTAHRAIPPRDAPSARSGPPT